MGIILKRWIDDMYEIETSSYDSEYVLEARFGGVLERAGLIEFIDELAAYEQQFPGHKLIVDFAPVSTVNLDHEDLLELAKYVQKADARSGKAALVTGSDVGRLFLAELYTDMVDVLAGRDNRAFQNRSDAFEWLGISGAH